MVRHDKKTCMYSVCVRTTLDCTTLSQVPDYRWPQYLCGLTGLYMRFLCFKIHFHFFYQAFMTDKWVSPAATTFIYPSTV